jgi:hypothetical protein
MRRSVGKSIVPLFICGKFISESCFCRGYDGAATIGTEIFVPSFDGYGEKFETCSQ